jgi:hypothetical protein
MRKSAFLMTLLLLLIQRVRSTIRSPGNEIDKPSRHASSDTASYRSSAMLVQS